MTSGHQRRITAGAVTRSIAHETGAAAVVVTDTDGALTGTPGAVLTDVKGYRAAGDNLDMVGVLQALFQATKPLTGKNAVPGPVDVTVLCTARQAEAIEAQLATGAIAIHDALHQLIAIRRRYEAITALGITVTFQVGTVDLDKEAEEQLERVVADQRRKHEAKLADQWQLSPQDAAWVEEHDATVVYTDGSHMTKTGFGSWAWCTDDGRSGAGTNAGITSTYVERAAILAALRSIDGPVLVVTDVLGVTAEGYGRTQVDGYARMMRRLRRELARGDVRVIQVAGHDRCAGNIAADLLVGQTLAAGWARISENADLAQRLVQLYEDRRAMTAQLRVRAGVRRQNRRDAKFAQKEARARSAEHEPSPATAS